MDMIENLSGWVENWNCYFNYPGVCFQDRIFWITSRERVFIIADEDLAAAAVLVHIDEVAVPARRDHCVVAQIALSEPLLKLTDRD
jgi:hypothetical protein